MQITSSKLALPAYFLERGIDKTGDRVSGYVLGICRTGSEDSSELSVYQPRLQLPDIWKQPPQRPALKKEDSSSKLPVLREAPGKGPTPPGA